MSTDKLYQMILVYKPEWATGMYLGTHISFGRRTNRKKAPSNYVFFSDIKQTIEETE